MGTFLPDLFSWNKGSRPRIDLNGRWTLRRDADDIGIAEGWHHGKGHFRQGMWVPGVPQAQGIGRPARNLETFFDEPFWIRRRFRVPELKAGKRLWLRIGGIVPAADIYLNGSHVGFTKSSRTPQRIDVTDLANPGENLIAIKVCGMPEVRLDGVYEMPGLTYNWTGPYGPISCEITGSPSITDLYVQPDLESNGIRLSVEISRPAREKFHLVVIVKDGGRLVGTDSVHIDSGEQRVKTFVGLDGYRAWYPEDPVLNDLDLSLYRAGAERVDKIRTRFGMRKLEVSGNKFLLNGRPVLMRLYGDNHLHPNTLSPPADKTWYLPRLKLARKFGMNGVKGCVEPIPPAYIEAADEVGMMIIQEMPFGLSSLRENRYTIGSEFRDYYSSELDGLVKTSRNHPSVVAYSMSSEVEYDKQTQESFHFFSRDLVNRTKKLAPHALVVDCTGYIGPDGLETAMGRRNTDFYVSLFAGRKDVLDETPPKTDGLLPLILHEYHWWSCYPDVGNREKYDGTQMKPFWLDSLERTARENVQKHLLKTYRKNSLWLQALCRKDGVEYVRRTPQIEGYILWLLIDLGLWSEGLLDDFWKPKNVSAEEFLKSNGDTVLVLGREGNRCYTAGDEVSIPILVDHYGGEALPKVDVEWRTRGGPSNSSGIIESGGIQPGSMATVGTVNIRVPAFVEPYRFELTVELVRGGKTINTNEWNFWAFPETFMTIDRVNVETVAVRMGSRARGRMGPNTSIVIADYADEELADFVEKGGRCILFSEGAMIEMPIGADNPKDPYKMFRTIPWNAGDHGNSGTVITKHPALSGFPHQGMCDLQFISMLKGQQPMDFGPLTKYGVEPIIRLIDHYAANRNVAHMIEFSVCEGKVLATSLGIMNNIEEGVEARYLLKCLMEYVGGDGFNPSAVVPREEFLRLFSQRE